MKRQKTEDSNELPFLNTLESSLINEETGELNLNFKTLLNFGPKPQNNELPQHLNTGNR